MKWNRTVIPQDVAIAETGPPITVNRFDAVPVFNLAIIAVRYLASDAFWSSTSHNAYEY
ncbi:MAG: hypothetical protein PCFJNLEI_01255 [Verrucomicrobiae bacterium]|nr:hypothetical protein [Verrucomicrobiae bacterium]